MKRNFKMSSNILPRDICRGPRWEFAVNNEIKRRELKMFAIANRASATRVGCHMSQLSRGTNPLYWKQAEGKKLLLVYCTHKYVSFFISCSFSDSTIKRKIFWKAACLQVRFFILAKQKNGQYSCTCPSFLSAGWSMLSSFLPVFCIWL